MNNELSQWQKEQEEMCDEKEIRGISNFALFIAAIGLGVFGLGLVIANVVLYYWVKN